MNIFQCIGIVSHDVDIVEVCEKEPFGPKGLQHGRGAGLLWRVRVAAYESRGPQSYGEGAHSGQGR
jgi:hypothetical protein